MRSRLAANDATGPSTAQWGNTMTRCLMLLAMAAALTGCKSNNLPPAQMLMEPGPGVGGPGPGVMSATPMTGAFAGGAMGGAGCVDGGAGFGLGAPSQVAFVGPEGMIVNWDVGTVGLFDSQPLVCPGRNNFPQGAIYRLKLSNIPGRPGVELYPSVEIAPTLPRTSAYLAHNAIPIQFTEEDFDQVASGNFVTKVIYLPDAEFQELALAGVETLVSTRLDPGVDPIVEADRRGAILGIVRLGNKDLQVPGMEGIYDGVPQETYEQVVPASYETTSGPVMGGHGMQPLPATGMMPPGDLPPAFLSGVTTPQYGMTMSGTPIGLPGPPHIPLGGPAGLQRHTIANHTPMHLPKPNRKIRIDAMQTPGFSYPKPPSHVAIHERVAKTPILFRQPLSDMFQFWNKKK